MPEPEPTHAVLLRGVNVGGHGKLPMADLRAALTAAGFESVATYIQSGNVVLAAGTGDKAVIAKKFRDVLTKRLRLDPAPGFVVLAAADLAEVIAQNPWPQVTEPKKLHVLFRDPDADASAEDAAADRIRAAIKRAEDKGSDDEAHLAGPYLYLHTPGGIGRSVLAVELAKRSSGADTGTTRNWATVLRVHQMLSG